MEFHGASGQLRECCVPNALWTMRVSELPPFLDSTFCTGHWIKVIRGEVHTFVVV